VSSALLLAAPPDQLRMGQVMSPALVGAHFMFENLIKLPGRPAVVSKSFTFAVRRGSDGPSVNGTSTYLVSALVPCLVPYLTPFGSEGLEIVV
jgi:hypothetical protein